jgi:hypothetical protein
VWLGAALVRMQPNHPPYRTYQSARNQRGKCRSPGRCFHLLSTRTGDSSVRSSLALASVVIKVNHTQAKTINLRSESGRSLPNLEERRRSYLYFIGTAYADKTAPTVPSTKTTSCCLNLLLGTDRPAWAFTSLPARCRLFICAAVPEQQ